MILAGDIGGTKTQLALFDYDNQGKLQTAQEQIFTSADFNELYEILSLFLPSNTKIDSACFGIAGPIVNQRCQTTNLPWVIEAKKLQEQLGTPKIKLLNDLEAMAIGMLNCPSEDMIELNPEVVKQEGNIAVIAAGTGLGEAILYWDGNKHHPIATEGGHCDFSPQTPQHDLLHAYLRKIFIDHVSWERILSGNGFGYLYDFLVASGMGSACPVVPPAGNLTENKSDRNAIISQLGLSNEDPLCSEVVRLFVELYGAEAGNLALKSFSTGGVFIGGGIAPKIQSAMESGHFIKSFTDKGRFKPFLNKMSVKICTNQKAPLLGAAHYYDQ